MKTKYLISASVVLLFLTARIQAKEVVYNLTIAKQEVIITGKSVTAMTINGGIPGPTLRFAEGDHAIIRVHNTMDTATSVHWHGMLVPPDRAGVPFITYPGIEPGGDVHLSLPHPPERHLLV